MAPVNQASLCVQLDDCRAQFDAIKQKGEASADTLAPINALFLLMDIVVAVFLEKTTPATSRNSSRVHKTPPQPRPTPRAGPGPGAAGRRDSTHAATTCVRSPRRRPARSPHAGGAATT